MEITRGVIQKAKKVVVYGPEGIGKSTFASKFPNPVFIDTEGSTSSMDVARLPRPTSWEMLREEIDYVKNNPHVCNTLVIDTIDWAEQLCIEFICAKHQKDGIEGFSYGNGYVYTKEEFGRFLNRLEDVIEKGVNVVLTAHAQMRKFEQPDEMGAYDRYELKLGKRTASQTSPLVKEWSDMLLFANYKTYSIAVDKDGKKHKGQGGKRVMYTSHHPCWDAKNRYGLDEELPFDYTEIAHILEKGMGQQGVRHAENEVPETKRESQDAASAQKEEKTDYSFVNIPEGTPEQMEFNTGPGTNTAADTATNKENEYAQEDRYFYHAESDCYWMVKKGQKMPTDPDSQISIEINKARYEAGTAKKAKPPEPDMSKNRTFRLNNYIPRALQDLMYEKLVSEEELLEAVYRRGFFPRGTPFQNLPDEFVEGCLIAAWPKVLAVIQDIRSNYEIPFD